MNDGTQPPSVFRLAALSEDLEDWPTRARPGDLTYLPRQPEEVELCPDEDTAEEQ